MLWIIFATLLFQIDTEADIETGNVVIDVVGFESDDGQVVAVLFSREEWGFPPNPNQAGFSSTADISNLAAHLEIPEVPAGDYVAMTFHDKNSNGLLDEDEQIMGLSGTPSSEQRPEFERMCFQHSGNVTGVRLVMREREHSRSGSGHPGGGMGGGHGGGGRPEGGGGHHN